MKADKVSAQRKIVILALRRLSGEDLEFQDTHGYVDRSYLKHNESSAQNKEK